MSDNTVTFEPTNTNTNNAQVIPQPQPTQQEKVVSQPVLVMPSKPHVMCHPIGTGRYIYSIFHVIMSLVAIYLAFKCNNGFDMGSFIIAFCCPYIYIIYILATKGTCGLLEKTN